MEKYLKLYQLIGVGDSYVQGKIDSHSYVLDTKNEAYFLLGKATLSADVDGMTRNRAEGCVVIAMAKILTLITTFYVIERETFKFYCDKYESIRYISLQSSTYTKMTQREIDLKMEMERLMSSKPIKFFFCEVDVHKDDDA